MDTLDFLAQVSAQINADGKFIAGKDAKATGQTTTGDLAGHAMLDGQTDYTDADLALATEALAWIRGYVGDDKFLTMLRAKVANDDMLFSGAAISAWVIPAFKRANGSGDGLDFSDYANSEYVGEVGKEVSFKGTIVSVQTKGTRWGPKQIIHLADKAGNLFVYLPSKERSDLPVGDVVYLSATVKSQTARENEPKTTRIKKPRFTRA